MQIRAVRKDIVVAAKSLNPALFGEQWLATYQIVEPGALTGQRGCTPKLAVAETSDLQLAATPERFQVVAKAPHVELARLVATVRRALHALPGTGWLAVGLNFHWELT